MVKKNNIVLVMQRLNIRSRNKEQLGLKVIFLVRFKMAIFTRWLQEYQMEYIHRNIFCVASSALHLQEKAMVYVYTIMGNYETQIFKRLQIIDFLR